MTTTSRRRWPPGYLLLTALGAAAWGARLAWRAVAQRETLGAVDPRLVIGALLAGAVLVLTPLASRALAGWRPEAGRRFTRRPLYWRLVLYAKFAALLAVVFGARHAQEAQLAVHLLPLLVLHRLALLRPARLQRAIEALEARRWVRVVDLVLANALLTVVLGELALRTLWAAQGRIEWSGGEPDPLATKLRGPMFGLEPNSLGYNDVEFSPERRPGERLRIAFLGDSFVVGSVPRAFSVVDRTEDLLNEGLGTPRPIEVLNFGIVATAPPEYLAALERDALRFRPDVVLVGIYLGNDIKPAHPVESPLSKRWYALYQLVDGWLSARRARAVEAAGEFVDLTKIEDRSRERWYEPGRIEPAVSRDKYLATERRHLDILDPTHPGQVDRDWGTALDALARIKARCDAAGVPLALEIFPDHVMVSPRFRREVCVAVGDDPDRYDLTLPKQRLDAFCREHAIPCFDLTPAFLAAGAAGDVDALYLPNDPHWSAPGNEVAARALADAVRGWLQDTGRWP